eukprot:scaffold250750_cov30-Tisochrysis_lutea.AAC.1
MTSESQSIDGLLSDSSARKGAQASAAARAVAQARVRAILAAAAARGTVGAAQGGRSVVKRAAPALLPAIGGVTVGNTVHRRPLSARRSRRVGAGANFPL